jgi:hypothetical protein
MSWQRVEGRQGLASHPGRKSGGDHEITWSSGHNGQRDTNRHALAPSRTNAIRRLVRIGLGTAGPKRKGTK